MWNLKSIGKISKTLKIITIKNIIKASWVFGLIGPILSLGFNGFMLRNPKIQTAYILLVIWVFSILQVTLLVLLVYVLIRGYKKTKKYLQSKNILTGQFKKIQLIFFIFCVCTFLFYMCRLTIHENDFFHLLAYGGAGHQNTGYALASPASALSGLTDIISRVLFKDYSDTIEDWQNQDYISCDIIPTILEIPNSDKFHHCYYVKIKKMPVLEFLGQHFADLGVNSESFKKPNFMGEPSLEDLRKAICADVERYTKELSHAMLNPKGVKWQKLSEIKTKNGLSIFNIGSRSTTLNSQINIFICHMLGTVIPPIESDTVIIDPQVKIGNWNSPYDHGVPFLTMPRLRTIIVEIGKQFKGKKYFFGHSYGGQWAWLFGGLADFEVVVGSAGIKGTNVTEFYRSRDMAQCQAGRLAYYSTPTYDRHAANTVEYMKDQRKNIYDLGHTASYDGEFITRDLLDKNLSLMLFRHGNYTRDVSLMAKLGVNYSNLGGPMILPSTKTPKLPKNILKVRDQIFKDYGEKFKNYADPFVEKDVSMRQIHEYQRSNLSFKIYNNPYVDISGLNDRQNVQRLQIPRAHTIPDFASAKTTKHLACPIMHTTSNPLQIGRIQSIIDSVAKSPLPWRKKIYVKHINPILGFSKNYSEQFNDGPKPIKISEQIQHIPMHTIVKHCSEIMGRKISISQFNSFARIINIPEIGYDYGNTIASNAAVSLLLGKDGVNFKEFVAQLSGQIPSNKQHQKDIRIIGYLKHFMAKKYGNKQKILMARLIMEFLKDIEPIQLPQSSIVVPAGMTPEDAKKYISKLFSKDWRSFNDYPGCSIDPKWGMIMELAEKIDCGLLKVAGNLKISKKNKKFLAKHLDLNLKKEFGITWDKSQNILVPAIKILEDTIGDKFSVCGLNKLCERLSEISYGQEDFNVLNDAIQNLKKWAPKIQYFFNKVFKTENFGIARKGLLNKILNSDILIENLKHLVKRLLLQGIKTKCIEIKDGKIRFKNVKNTLDYYAIALSILKNKHNTTQKFKKYFLITMHLVHHEILDYLDFVVMPLLSDLLNLICDPKFEMSLLQLSDIMKCADGNLLEPINHKFHKKISELSPQEIKNTAIDMLKKIVYQDGPGLTKLQQLKLKEVKKQIVENHKYMMGMYDFELGQAEYSKIALRALLSDTWQTCRYGKFSDFQYTAINRWQIEGKPTEIITILTVPDIYCDMPIQSELIKRLIC